MMVNVVNVPKRNNVSGKALNEAGIQKLKASIKYKYPVGFHLLDFSPWPLFASFSCLVSTVGVTMYMHGYLNGGLVCSLGVSMVMYSMYVWWRDVIRESTYQGCHTKVVQIGLRYGVLLFIVSEVMFFLAFFWAFFHSSLSPTVSIGGVWPPKGIEVLSAWELPALNTLLLLSSGASVTWCHHSLICGDRNSSLYGLGLTILLAVIFTMFQGIEYAEAPFTISDGIYGCCFYLATGFHGFHVLVGTLFLGVCWYRLYNNHLTSDHHFGVEAGIFYWHFVDVVWLFLFVSIYYWGGKA